MSFEIILLVIGVVFGALFFWSGYKNVTDDKRLLTIHILVGLGCFGILSLSYWGAKFFSLEQPRLPFVFIAFFFLTSGIAHTFVLSRYYKTEKDFSTFSTGLLSLFIGIMGSFIFIGLGKVLTSGATRYQGCFDSAVLFFFLPFLSFVVFRAWQRIPKPEYEAWEYNENYQPEPPHGREKINFEFRFKDKIPSQEVSAPDYYKIGDAFHLLIKGLKSASPGEQIKTIYENVASEPSPYKWIFYRQFAWWSRKRYFRADASIREIFPEAGKFRTYKDPPVVKPGMIYDPRFRNTDASRTEMESVPKSANPVNGRTLPVVFVKRLKPVRN